MRQSDNSPCRISADDSARASQEEELLRQGRWAPSRGFKALLANGDLGSLRIILEIVGELGLDAIGRDALCDLLGRVGKSENRGRSRRNRDRDANLSLPYGGRPAAASGDRNEGAVVSIVVQQADPTFVRHGFEIG
ncbi:hypothetical protein [Bradyrhizobium zhanjiangense]|uniref:hypothetical protein n=1 Tax=Bradyrhizobium zhanjiangense TaxID=1325107 RepID=UPI0013E8C82F|nr:hypothetical protein [Bradyrhizobium zhanjiangense]